MIEVAPVTIPASTLIVPSNTIADPAAGVIFTAPDDVLSVTAASPWVKLSEAREPAATPVKLDPSPLNAFAVTVPVVVKFSLLKFIVPPESVMLPVDIVIVPSIVATSVTVKSSVVVNCSAVTVPVVVKLSLSKSIVPPESVILPFARVRLPTVEPVGRVAACEKVTAPPLAIEIASSPSVNSINGV